MPWRLILLVSSLFICEAQASLKLTPTQDWQLVVHGHVKQTFHLTEYSKKNRSKYYFVQFIRGQRPIAERLIPQARWLRWQQALSQTLGTLSTQKNCREVLSWGKTQSSIQLPGLCLDEASTQQIGRLNQTLNEMTDYLRAPL